MDSNNTNNLGLDSQMNENVPQTEAPVQQSMPQQPVEAPVQPQQPVEAPVPQPQPMPVQQPPKKKGKGGMIAIIIISVVLVLGLLIGGGIIVFGMLGSPVSKVSKGLANLTAEMNEYKNPVMEKVQLSEIMQKMNEGSSTIGTSLNITDSGSGYPIGFDMSADVDTKNKQLDMDMAFSIMNISMASIRFAADEQNIFVEIPEFFDETLKLPVEGFAQKFNESELAYGLGMELPEDFDINLFADLEDAESGEVQNVFFSDEFMEIYEQDVKDIRDSMKIEKYDGAKGISVDGKTVKCNGYSITAGKEEINQLYKDILEELANGKFGKEVVASMYLELAEYGYTEAEVQEQWETAMENMSISIEDDLKFVVYLDSKSRIVSIEAEEINMLIGYEEVGIDFEVNFLGKERTLDQITGVIHIFNDYNEITFQLARDAELSKSEYNDKWVMEMIGDIDYDEYMKIEFVNQWNVEDMEYYIDLLMQDGSEGAELEMEASGSISDYTAGRSCTFEIDDATVYSDLETILMVSGSFNFGVMEESIEMPTEGWEILNATQTELENFIMEIFTNMNSLVEEGIY